MTTAIDWHFDPISPFAYLAFERLPRALPADVSVRYVPQPHCRLARGEPMRQRATQRPPAAGR